ncbi:DUF1592 domain-containing protein [uncultured Rubinisphaera sp.]|uniref:DUF1592 domain-containing protein n=1 Tax=uncultured Rubinisphaera sp. TaxID=1678686 RepID=UPI0030D78B33
MWKAALNAKNLRLAVASSLILVLMLNTSATHSAEDFSESFQSLTQKHCVKCHGAEEEIYGEVNLKELSLDDLKTNSELLRSLIDVLDLQEMPPEDEPQLSAENRQLLVNQFQNLLHESLASERRYLHTPIRRMNRFQYNNAVVDLFDLKCIVFTLPERMMRDHKGYFQPETGKMAEVVTVGSRPLGKSQLIEPRLMGVAAFPQDLRAEHGYDNRGDHLSLSPLLMEAFLKLGQSIVESPDFTPKKVGIWREFFAAPAEDVDQSAEVRLRLKKFLFKAFRQPVAESQLERYIGYVQHQLESGVHFPEAMKSVAAATIASPNFLYLYDKTDPIETSAPLDDFELASRLSFFLWSSLPDETLLELATNGDLSKPEVLDVQVERMLKDKKIKRFCDSFPSQWLQLERIISSVPDRGKYPDFYFSKYRDSMHMMLEPLLLFETVLIENQPITQFIDSDFTYRSILLEEAYGELATEPVDKNSNEVTTLTFHRVPVTDRRNGGLITNAAVMTMTSGPERTQPITRGAWIAGVIFNNPPEPPPADVPALGEKPAEGEEHLTLRERLSLHRERSDCKGCHEQIDPLGFALENYNPIGVWRDQYENGREIDMQGTLFRQHQFNNVIEFKDAILSEKDRFTRALAGHLLSYALARELGAADQIALDEMTQSVISDKYRFQSLIKQIVFSEPFQSKSSPKIHVVLE